MTNERLKLRKATPQRLRSLGFNEAWLQQQIYADPSLLGLGDLTVIQREKIQSSGGRLDFLMADFATETRYEIEMMLGAVDESHIIRTIEYWDIERQRYPTLDHRAVIVAEEITSRFFNVIRLLNRAVPIIAIQLSAFRVEDEVVLQFIRVLDTADFGADPDEEVPAEPVNREFWQNKAQPDMLATVDAVKGLLTKDGVEPKVTYNKSHVVIATTGYNFCWFYPRRVAKHCVLNVKVGPDERQEIIDQLQANGVEAENVGRSSVRVDLTAAQVAEHREALKSLFEQAEKWSHR